MYSATLKFGLNKLKINKFNCFVDRARRLYTTQAPHQPEDEYTSEPQYPQVMDICFKARKAREELAWHEEVKKVTTVEGKLLKVNMPKYWGWETYAFDDVFHRYNCLPYYRHWTRTNFKAGIPADYYRSTVEEENTLIGELRGLIENAVAMEVTGYRNGLKQIDDPKERERQLSLNISERVNRILLCVLSQSVKHLKQIELDVEPRHEAGWMVGGIDPSPGVVKWRQRRRLPEDMANRSIDKPFQYTGRPLLTLRNREPLQPVYGFDHEEVLSTTDIPKIPFEPLKIGYPIVRQHLRSIPGVWPGTEHQFGQLLYLDRRHLVDRNPDYGAADEQNALHAQAILSSYAWLLGQACYQGFSTYNDLTYPLVAQTIITNGKLWSFYVYQLNTTGIHNLAIDSNPRANQCWGTTEMKLYDEIDADGKLLGFNDEIVRHLIRFYRNAPKARDHEMRPYLGAEEQTVADIEDPKRRAFLESAFKHILSNRPRHRVDRIPEIYDWERIYKIENKMMPMEPRLRFFEIGQNPWKRRLDEHTPKYIPKHMRPGGPKSKEKWEKTYWP